MKPYAWQEDGILYTFDGLINRFSENYQIFLDQLYYSAFQNPFYRKNLEDSGSRKLDHVISEENDVCRTTLTRTEYISRLYALRYCIYNHLYNEEQVMMTLKKVRNELK